jgi:hypothetical protein
MRGLVLWFVGGRGGQRWPGIVFLEYIFSYFWGVDGLVLVVGFSCCMRGGMRFWFSCCMRNRGFEVGFNFYFL